jgi:diacylglycerol kinase-like protein
MGRSINQRFERILVLCNPASTRAKEAWRHIQDLKELSPGDGWKIVETTGEGRKSNQALLRELAPDLGEHTLLCIAAGDGTVNMVIDLLLTDPALPEAARRTPILPLWGGNANDLAHMLNGRPWRTSLRTMLEQGSIIPIHPLQCELEGAGPGAPCRHLAACYASFGASAFAAHRLSQPNRRRHPLDAVPGGRVLKELVVVIKAMLDAPQINVGEGDQTTKFYEHIFLKGSRFAKVKGVRLDLTDPHFYHTVMRHKRARSLFFHIWELTRARPHKPTRVAGDHAEFTLLDPAWAQFDGEVLELPARAHVTVTLSKRSFYALSTKLAGKP